MDMDTVIIGMRIQLSWELLSGNCCHGNGDTAVMDMSTVVIGMRIWLLWELVSWEWEYCLHGNEDTVLA